MQVPIVWSSAASNNRIERVHWKTRLRSHLAALAWTIGLASPAVGQSVNVLTHHYDALRTGWNDRETVLSASNAGQIQLQNSVGLDEQVDAQPLLVTSQTIANQGVHDVIYIATENNGVYAIDAGSGAILINRNLGTAVSINNLLGQCNNNSAVVGINSTPAIDLTTQTMYLITYTWENSSPVYRLYALDLGSLADKIPSVVIGGSATLSDARVISSTQQ